MKIWRITGRHFSAPPPADWHAQLVKRLGYRPRRLGAWVELALFGARCCLDDVGEENLPAGTLLTLSSLHGPDIALRAALGEAQDGPPMPIAFLNSQTAQVLPALAQMLAWRGNGRCLTTRDPALALLMATLEAGPQGMLAGWVDEDAPGKSIWLRLVPAPTDTGTFTPATFAMLEDPCCNFLAFDGMQLKTAD